MTAEGGNDEMIEESSITVSSGIADESVAFPRDGSPKNQKKSRSCFPKRLWIKRDVDYDLDLSYCDKILNRFIFHVNTLKEGGTYERDINEDAFYYKYMPISPCDIETIKDSPDLRDKMSCRRLREMSLQLIDLCMKLNRDGEGLIDLETTTSELSEDTRALIRDSILKKKRILNLLHKVRNYIGEIILMGEKCYNHIEKSSAIAFKQILSLED
ncbi:hypothetical protein EROM_040950 [Encephalitozoon romaleae SJ-2008]|uniref:Uncharacterized protein n=1 Tax=Encephalitozoon romaleae (strain SJ-2008) TaxID=1178016 RepID=I7AR77_ENCRO|nr:hypothetical protein EROM_040950 [Encephalitozoon romaleae SJ-2008]AFN82862.1 hypothetical protein EROM_040950 [Encephalitozoon romaleae SJ-2008]